MQFAAQYVSAQSIQINTLNEPVSIAGSWSFNTGDKPLWADPDFDSSSWSTVTVPSSAPEGFEGYAGVAWYRITLVLNLDNDSAEDQLGALGVTLGMIMSAYEVYANGQLLGGVGGLPPNQKMMYDQYKTYAIPRSVVGDEGRIVIALRVWRYEKLGENWEMGPYGGPFEVGNIGALQQRATERAIFPSLVLAIIYLVIGLYHILIARKKPELQEYFWFGLLSTALAAYSFELSQWRYTIDIPYLAHKKIEFFALYISPFLFTEALRRIIKIELNIFVRIFQYSFLLLAIVVVAVLNQDIHYLTLATFQKMATVWSVGATVMIGWLALQGNSRARLVLLLLVILAATALNDVVFGSSLSGGVSLINFGFATTVLLMSVALAERYTNILNTLEQLVDQRTSELQESNDHLRDALNAKSQFLDNMSHEFRTPIHAITGMTSLTLKTDLNDKQRGYLNRVNSAAQALRGIIENVLDFARLDAGELEKIDDEFEMTALLSKVASLAELKADEKQLSFSARIEDNVPPLLEGDAQRIAQVLGLLLDNAIKFTESGSVSLNIACSNRTDDHATIDFSVSDTGVGISAEDQSGIYDVFSQADNSLTRQHGGTGLGLALSQQLVRLMDGELEFSSDIGTGSCFKMALSLKVAQTHPA